MSNIVKRGGASAFIREQMAKGKTPSQIRKLAVQQGIKFSANLPYVVRSYDRKNGPALKARVVRKTPVPLTKTEKEVLRLVFFRLGTERATTLINEFQAEIERRLA